MSLVIFSHTGAALSFLAPSSSSSSFSRSALLPLQLPSSSSSSEVSSSPSLSPSLRSFCSFLRALASPSPALSFLLFLLRRLIAAADGLGTPLDLNSVLASLLPSEPADEEEHREKAEASFHQILAAPPGNDDQKCRRRPTRLGRVKKKVEEFGKSTVFAEDEKRRRVVGWRKKKRRSFSFPHTTL